MADVPVGPVTVTSTMPTPAGLVAVICVSELTVNDVATVLPNFTAVAPVKFPPVMTTWVPPLGVPCTGLDVLSPSVRS